MKKAMKRIMALAFCLMLMLTMVDLSPIVKAATFYGDYTDVSKVYDYGSCPSMQGMAVGSQMLYTIKINSNDSLANIYMTDKDSGTTTRLYDTSDGSYYFSGFGHANDMAVWGIDGYSQIFVTSTEKGMGAITRLQRDGSGLTRVAYYNLTYNGEEIEATAFDIMSVSNGQINFITKLGQTVYTGSVSTSATNATIPLTKLCIIDKSKVTIKGETLDLSDWVNQGFGYHDEMLFVPITGPDSTGELNRSVVCVYNLQDIVPGCTIYPTDVIAFRVTSGTYSALFEIESVDICSSDKKLYFNTNRRKTNSDTNHDGVSYFDGYTFEKLTPDPDDIKSYTVKYNANGGTGTMEDTVVPYGVTTNLRKNAFTKAGYKFAGWTAYRTAKNQWFYTNGSSSGWYAEGSQPAGYTKSVYSDGAGVAATTSVDKDTCIFYAQWEVDNTSYTAKFDANGGTGTAMSDVTFTNTSTGTLPACTYTKFGHDFSGWKVSGTNTVLAAGTPLKNLVSYAGTGNTVTLQATWTAKKYTIDWKVNDTVYTTTTETYGQPITAPSYTVPSGYSFSGWNVPETMPNYNLVLNATLTANAYDVNFYDENGTKLYTQKNVAYGTTPSYNGAALTKSPDSTHHYTFSGWSTTKGGSVTGLSPVNGSNLNYYAVYTATAHTVATKEENRIEATCATTGSYELVKYCSVSGCGFEISRETKTLPANGSHNYMNGYCFDCGAADPGAVVPVTPAITLKGTTLSLEDEILYNLYFTTSDMDVTPENMGLLVYNSQPSTISVSNADQKIDGAIISSNMYMVSTEGIPGKNLADTKYLVAYAKLGNGQYVYSSVLPYSAKSYCMDRLEKSSNANLKSLCVAILNYGSAAQEYFAATSDYTYTTLMNADLTAAQKALVKAYASDMMDARGTVTAAKAGTFGTAANGFTGLGATMSADGIFSINYYFTTSTAVSDVTMYYWNAEDFAKVSTLTTANATGSKAMTPSGKTNQFWADVDGIAAKNLDDTVYVCGVYTVNGTTYSTGVIPYSLGYYCVTMAQSGSATMKPMAAATAVYGYYAKIYFGV